MQLRQARAGDRYLLCSDGLRGTVSAEAISQVLRTRKDPDQAVRDLIALAIDAGGPDNVTCIVADVTGQEVARPLMHLHQRAPSGYRHPS